LYLRINIKVTAIHNTRLSAVLKVREAIMFPSLGRFETQAQILGMESARKSLPSLAPKESLKNL
uniref:hypothetical protein n=1 Tax=Streptococcus salivarius TaxID=1304 RepID=UPI001C0BDEF4